MAFEIEAYKYNLAMAKSGAQSYLDNTPLKGLTTVLSKNTIDNAEVQEQLDLLSVSDAKKYETVLAYLFKENRDVYYIGVESYTAAYTGSNQASYRPSNANQVSYTTKHFHATAKIYAQTPVNKKFDIGFSQVCTSRPYCRAIYTDDNLSARWLNSTGFPCSDAASGSTPFYFVGSGVNCTHNTADRNIALSGSVTYEMDDNFQNNSFTQRFSYKKGGLNKQTNLSQIKREQYFTAWVVYRPAGSGAYKLLRESKWGINATVDVDNSSGSASYADTNINIVTSTPSVGSTLTPVASGNSIVERCWIFQNETQLTSNANAVSVP